MIKGRPVEQWTDVHSNIKTIMDDLGHVKLNIKCKEMLSIASQWGFNSRDVECNLTMTKLFIKDGKLTVRCKVLKEGGNSTYKDYNLFMMSNINILKIYYYLMDNYDYEYLRSGKDMGLL